MILYHQGSRDDLKVEETVLLMIAKTEKSKNPEKLIMKKPSRDDLKVEEIVLRMIGKTEKSESAQKLVIKSPQLIVILIKRC